MVKRFIAIIMVIAVMETFTINAFAIDTAVRGILNESDKCDKKVINKEDFEIRKGYAFEEDDYKFVSKKIEDEKKNYTGILDKDKENSLNEYGVFDEEISLLGDEELEFISSTPIEELMISTTIIACEDKESGENDMVELTPEQIDKYYAQKYYDQCNDLENEMQLIFSEKKGKGLSDVEDATLSSEIVTRDITKSTMVDNEITSDSINKENLIKINNVNYVYGYANISENGDEKTAYLKYTVYATKNTSGKVTITFTATWTNMPDYRLVDYIKFDWSGLKYDSGTYYVKHNVKDTCYKYTYYSPTHSNSAGVLKNQTSSVVNRSKTLIKTTEEWSKNEKFTHSEYCIISENSVKAYAQLYEDNQKITWLDSSYTTYVLEKHYFTNESISAYIILEDVSGDDSFECEYIHYYVKKKEVGYEDVAELVYAIATKDYLTITKEAIRVEIDSKNVTLLKSRFVFGGSIIYK